MKKLFLLSFLIFVLFGCSNTETKPFKEKTAGEKTAFILDVLIASAIYNETNFGVGKEYIKTSSVTKSNSTTNTSIFNGGIHTNTITNSTTKSKSSGFGFGIGN